MPPGLIDDIHFYPRPPRGGRPAPPDGRDRAGPISTHALREEGDAPPTFLLCSGVHFYPRPPRGGRLIGIEVMPFEQQISTHALREEGDPLVEQLSPCIRKISTHALREEGDAAWVAML